MQGLAMKRRTPSKGSRTTKLTRRQPARARIVAEAKLPTRFGRFTVLGIQGRQPGQTAVALRQLGVRRVRLLSNNPDKVRQLEQAGIRVVERVPCQPRASRASRAYLQAKKAKLGHLLAGV